MLVSAAVTAAAPAAFAQAAPALRVRGTITAVTGGTITVKTKSGKDTPIKLGDKVAYGWVAPIALSAVKKGAYIGTAAVNEPDGSVKALEIHVFPEAMRGAGEGYRGWDLGADTSMTNGTIGDVTSTNGETLHVSYKGGEKIVHIPPGIPIVTFEPATAQEVLKPGMHVLVTANEAADGALTAVSIRGGKDGIVPPM
jgi:hypothetical protein